MKTFNMGYFAVGDIHGNFKALMQVIERSGFDAENDTLIGIGDYVDGHPESAKVVEYLSKLPNFIGILGNHDVWCRQWLKFGVSPDIWVMQGGKKTLESYIELNPELMVGLNKDRHLKFFDDLHNYYILDIPEFDSINDITPHKRYAFVHAGWTSDKGLGNEEYIADYYWDRKLWSNSLHKSMIPYVDKRWKWDVEPEFVFIGHTATNYDMPEKSKNPPISGYNGKLINLDQGAGYDGYLTICNIETQEYWQSDDGVSLYGRSGR